MFQLIIASKVINPDFFNCLQFIVLDCVIFGRFCSHKKKMGGILVNFYTSGPRKKFCFLNKSFFLTYVFVFLCRDMCSPSLTLNLQTQLRCGVDEKGFSVVRARRLVSKVYHVQLCPKLYHVQMFST